MLKIGLDIHGVIDIKPKIYSKLSRRLIELGHQVHVITGPHVTIELVKELFGYGISYTHVFSISDYHKMCDTPMRYDEKGNPWIDKTLWNKTKAEYCHREKIDLHIDDSAYYGQYFKSTIYLEIKK